MVVCADFQDISGSGGRFNGFLVTAVNGFHIAFIFNSSLSACFVVCKFINVSVVFQHDFTCKAILNFHSLNNVSAFVIRGRSRIYNNNVFNYGIVGDLAVCRVDGNCAVDCSVYFNIILGYYRNVSVKSKLTGVKAGTFVQSNVTADVACKVVTVSRVICKNFCLARRNIQVTLVGSDFFCLENRFVGILLVKVNDLIVCLVPCKHITVGARIEVFQFEATLFESDKYVIHIGRSAVGRFVSYQNSVHISCKSNVVCNVRLLNYICKRRNEHCRKNGDDGNYNYKFDYRKAALFTCFHLFFLLLHFLFNNALRRKLANHITANHYMRRQPRYDEKNQLFSSDFVEKLLFMPSRASNLPRTIPDKDATTAKNRYVAQPFKIRIISNLGYITFVLMSMSLRKLSNNVEKN